MQYRKNEQGKLSVIIFWETVQLCSCSGKWWLEHQTEHSAFLMGEGKTFDSSLYCLLETSVMYSTQAQKHSHAKLSRNISSNDWNCHLQQLILVLFNSSGHGFPLNSSQPWFALTPLRTEFLTICQFSQCRETPPSLPRYAEWLGHLCTPSLAPAFLVPTVVLLVSQTGTTVTAHWNGPVWNSLFHFNFPVEQNTQFNAVLNILPVYE